MAAELEPGASTRQEAIGARCDAPSGPGLREGVPDVNLAALVPQIIRRRNQNLERRGDARRRALLAILSGRITQGQLARALGVTQATIARDIARLGIAKVRGRYVVDGA